MKMAIFTCNQNRAIDNERGEYVTLSRDEEFRHQAVHWSDLHRILYDSLPSGIAHLGHEVTALTENSDGSSMRVTVSVATGGEAEDGSTAFTNKEIHGDIVVAADGSMSQTQKLFSPNDEKRYVTETFDFRLATALQYSDLVPLRWS